MNELYPTAGHCVSVVHLLCCCENWHEKNIEKHGDYQIKGDGLQSLVGVAEMALRFIEPLKLIHTQGAAIRLQTKGSGVECSSKDALNAIRNLRESLFTELNSVQFLRATPDMVEYLSLKIPFGPFAAKAFHECMDDIGEACKCFAMERYTASVFHLGRAMERAAAKLAKKMKVGNPTDDWQGYLKAINKKIDSMPYSTKAERAKRAPYAEAAAFSFQFKEAWRNPTAHPERTYTRDQAIDVLNGARAFMDAAARKIFKVKLKPVI